MTEPLLQETLLSAMQVSGRKYSRLVQRFQGSVVIVCISLLRYLGNTVGTYNTVDQAFFFITIHQTTLSDCQTRGLSDCR